MLQRLTFLVAIVAAAAVCIVTGALVIRSATPHYVPYVPIEAVWSGQEVMLAEAPDLLTPLHACRMMIVLTQEGRPFEFRGGQLFILNGLQEDHEQLWDYSSKADDPAWLARHTGLTEAAPAP
jgi:hypothetical protein